jgi:hypothetical protein
MNNSLTTHKLAKLKAQKAKLDTKFQLAEALYKTTQQKHDTRHKILVSAYTLEQVQKLDSFLTRDCDAIYLAYPPLF